MTAVEKKSEDIRAAWMKCVAEKRRSTLAPIAPVGFDYAKAISAIQADKKNGYTLEEIAECMGISNVKIIRGYRDQGKIPDHLGGESLWGLYENVFGKGSAKTDLTGPEHTNWDERELLEKKE